MSIRMGLQTEPIASGELVQWAKHPAAGAVVLFLGTTRDSFDGKGVVSLAYEAYEPRARKTLETIARAVAARDGVSRVALVHRLGTVPLMEDSVAIVVSAAHRREGWDAAEWALEEIKHSAEIWKREMYTDGTSEWVQGCARQTVSRT